MNDSTFDQTKNYKKVCYRADRDLLNSELNEAQDIENYERRTLLDMIFSQGTIISGLEGTVDDDQVVIVDGIVYLDGCAVNVPGASLSIPEPGEHTIYVDVFRRVVTATEDDTLVNPLTGEPTAEREKWIATLQTRDTTGDPLPEGALSRTVAPVYIFNRDTDELRTYAGTSPGDGDILTMIRNHIGHGGLDRHPAASLESAGFMSSEQLAALISVEETLPDKADVSALNAHKTSADHDGRYYTETESDNNFAPKSHVGAGGISNHPAATTSTAGFMASSDKTQLNNHETRIVTVETALPGKADLTALNAHKTSGDHDGRYFTETESDARFAPITHVGAGGSAHALASPTQNGFISKELSAVLANMIQWTCEYDYGNDNTGALPYRLLASSCGMTWRGRCDSGSVHRLLCSLRATGTTIAAIFEIYHITGTVVMVEGSRVHLHTDYPSTVPGSKIYLVQLYPDSFTSVDITASGSGEIGFSLSIFPGDDRQICYELDPNRAGKPVAG